jgi:hypothetical protein
MHHGYELGDKVVITSQELCDWYDMLGVKVGDVVEVCGYSETKNQSERDIVVEFECLPLYVSKHQIKHLRG